MIVALQALLILLVGGFVLAPVIRQWGELIPREAAMVNRRRSCRECALR